MLVVLFMQENTHRDTHKQRERERERERQRERDRERQREYGMSQNKERARVDRAMSQRKLRLSLASSGNNPPTTKLVLSQVQNMNILIHGHDVCVLIVPDYPRFGKG